MIRDISEVEAKNTVQWTNLFSFEPSPGIVLISDSGNLLAQAFQKKLSRHFTCRWPSVTIFEASDSPDLDGFRISYSTLRKNRLAAM